MILEEGYLQAASEIIKEPDIRTYSSPLKSQSKTPIQKWRSEPLPQTGKKSDMLMFTGDKDDPITFNPDFLDAPQDREDGVACQLDAIESSLQAMGLDVEQASSVEQGPLLPSADVYMQLSDQPVIPSPDLSAIAQADQAIVAPVEEDENIEARSGQPQYRGEPRRSRKAPVPRNRKFEFVERHELFQGKKIKQFLNTQRQMIPRSFAEPILEYWEHSVSDAEEECNGRYKPVTSLSDEIMALFATNIPQDEEDPLNFLMSEQPTRHQLDIMSVVDVVPPLDAAAISDLVTGTFSHPDFRPCKFLYLLFNSGCMLVNFAFG